MAEYADRDIIALDRVGGHYTRHVSAMTAEGLHSKADIAAELAWRDREIARLRSIADWFNKTLDFIFPQRILRRAVMAGLARRVESGENLMGLERKLCFGVMYADISRGMRRARRRVPDSQGAVAGD